MPEQKLTWEQLPKFIKDSVYDTSIVYAPELLGTSAVAAIGNYILEKVKPELEKAWNARTETRYKDDGDSYESIVIYDFETWYQNTYLK